jgi:type IV secretion system protein VirB10
MSDTPRNSEFPNLDRTGDDSFAEDQAGPTVGRTSGGISPVVTIGGFAVAAVLLFLILNGQRQARQARDEAASAPSVATSDWSPPPLELPKTQVADAGPTPFTGLPTQVGPPPAPAIAAPIASALPPPAPIPSANDAPDSVGRLRAPSVVVDLGGGARGSSGAPAATAPPAAAAPAAQAANGERSQLNDSEQFAKRVGDEAPESARATSMRNLSSTAPQGTLIPGVLETAINSDLPGFARAIVSRDVLSFDGKAVLIPRSSRLIGQYKSATALGQSRAFVIWTRIIRPDGVSIQIGSPGTDELGRGGLDGKVDRHFFARFSGSILLSVLNAGIASVSKTPSTQISIGSPGAAAGLASSVVTGDVIPPTIKVAQGAAINVFVARDLDFSGVEPVK